jgi:hypothetical protein
MNNKKLDAVQVWKQMEDLLAPQLHFSLGDRAIYSHLLRHSRLEGKVQLQFSIAWLARGVGVSCKFTRDTVRRLIARGVLHLVECNCRSQHVVRLRLPLEVKGICEAKIAGRLPGGPAGPAPAPHAVVNMEEADFLQKQNLRGAIHAREGGRCFYCLRRITPHRRCLDHVVPRAELGQNSKPGVLLSGMQLAEGGAPRRRVSAQALPRAPFEYRRAHWPPPRLVCPLRRQTHSPHSRPAQERKWK